MNKNKGNQVDPIEHDEKLITELRYRLLRISQVIRRETRDLPVTQAQSSVLSALMLGRPMRLTDLANAEAVALPTMNQVVNRMIGSGWVMRVPQKGSSVVLIEITEKGRRIAKEVAEIRNRGLQARLSNLSKRELSALPGFMRMIDKLYPKDQWILEAEKQQAEITRQRKG